MATHHFARQPPPRILACQDKTRREQEIGQFISRVTKQPESLESSLVQMEELEAKFNRVIRRTVLPGFSDPIGITEESRASLATPATEIDIRAPPLPEPFWVKYTTVKEQEKSTNTSSQSILYSSASVSQDNSSSMDMSPMRDRRDVRLHHELQMMLDLHHREPLISTSLAMVGRNPGVGGAAQRMVDVGGQ